MTVALVTTTGGHLAELVRLRPRLREVEDVVWITFDSPQSRSVLEGEDVIFVRYMGPRQFGPALANAVEARRILRDRGVTAVISNGAAIALSFMVPARMLGLPCVYIESAARRTGASVTARVLRVVPGVRFYTQYPSLQSRRWRFAGSVLDGYVASTRPAPSGPLRVVVTVGLMKEFSFRRMVERAVEILPPEAEVVWQTGATEVDDLPIEADAFVPEHELRAEIEAADVVVSHAGVGTALLALDAGRMPILVPRLERYGENVDDHQCEIAEELSARGLAVSLEVEELDLGAIEGAARAAVEAGVAPPIALPLDL